MSLVSGHIRGATNTVPPQAEILYNEYNFAAAIAVAVLLALVTLAIKSWIEWRLHQTDHAGFTARACHRPAGLDSRDRGRWARRIDLAAGWQCNRRRFTAIWPG